MDLQGGGCPGISGGAAGALSCSSKLPGQKYAWYSHKAVLATTGITGKKKEGLRVPGISLAA